MLSHSKYTVTRSVGPSIVTRKLSDLKESHHTANFVVVVVIVVVVKSLV